MQAWAGLTAGNARAMAIHAMSLASRSEGSRLGDLGTRGCKIGQPKSHFHDLCRKKSVVLIKRTIRTALSEDGEG